MRHLFDNSDLTRLCAAVFDKADVTQEEVAEELGVSQVAVSYMIGNPDKSMSRVRKRFLREVGGMTVEGPGYYVDDSTASISLDEVSG